MSDATFLDALIRGLDLAAFERRPDGAFVLVAEPPSWWPAFFTARPARGEIVALAERFPFLGNFLVDAASVWDGSTAHASQRSGLWIEADAHDRACHFEAVAVRAGTRDVLLVERATATHATLQQVIQRGREQSLELHDERRAADALRRERASLEAQVADGHAALAETATQLHEELIQRRRAESRARFLALGVEHATELVCTTDDRFVITYGNRAFVARFGFSPGAPPERRIADLLVQPAAGAALEARARQGHWAGDLRCVTSAGEAFPASVSASPVADDSGAVAGYIFVMQDVSEQVRARRALAQVEEQLRHAVKMEAVGQLAGGIAHDFNNLLTAMLGYCELALDDLPPGLPARADVERVRREADRAAALTRQLLMFSRRQVHEPTVLDLGDVTRRAADLLRHIIGESIRLEMRAATDLWPVLADAGHLEQLIVNLAVNARDAMPLGGTLTVTVENRRVEAPLPSVNGPIPPGDHVVLEVADTGTGIDPLWLHRIFEPFFTTKPGAKGTGLGLSVVHGIVQQSGGHIQVRSAPGAGTVFSVHLPRTTVPWTAVADEARAAEPDGGHETILLVEDEATVRELLVSLLDGRGYTVLTAARGAEALALAAQHAGPIHLLVTDVVLPEGNGRQLAEAITATRPDSRVLYISGYTDDVVLPHGIEAGGGEFLQKPFLPGTFLERVRQLLDLPARRA